MNERNCEDSSKRTEKRDVIGLELYFLRQIVNPFRLSWTLIKLGYEPLAPVRFYSPLAMVGWTAPLYVYPNIFHYVYHTIRTFGFWKVVSTGVLASACSDFISAIFHRAFTRRSSEWGTSSSEESDVPFHSPTLDSDDELIQTTHTQTAFRIEEKMEESKWTTFLLRLLESVSFKSWEILLTQPFLVVMVRQAASLIGEEPQYSWFPVAVQSVYRENGLGGFFQGVVPRLVGELFGLVTYYTCCRLIRRWIFGLHRKRTTSLCITEVILYLGLRSYVYPFELTGCIMTVRGAKLEVAKEANSFADWRALRNYLLISGQANRGWFPIFRSHVQSKDLPIELSS